MLGAHHRPQQPRNSKTPLTPVMRPTYWALFRQSPTTGANSLSSILSATGIRGASASFSTNSCARQVGGVDWTTIDANEVHAARYVGAATADSSFLAEVLLPGVAPMDEIAAGTLADTAGERKPRAAADIFRAMMAHKRAYPGQPWNK